MDRAKAINLLNEIRFRVEDFSPNAIALAESEPDDPSSTGVKIQFKCLSDECTNQVRKIAERYALCIKEEGNNLTIYSAKAKAKTTTK
jgi:hypothetical protein